MTIRFSHRYKAFVATLLGLSSGLLASIATALPLADYPHAKVIFDEQEAVDGYRLTLGELKKANNQWRAEREQRLSGELQRKTLEMEPGIGSDEVFDYYRRQLQQLDGRELFYCQGRRCGSSNSWANTRFKIKQLYGLDQTQLYSAFEVQAQEGSRSYVALYGVRRGNKRHYVQLDVVTTNQMVEISSSPEVIQQQLEQGLSFTLPGIQAADQSLAPEHMDSVLQALKYRRHWTVAIVGRDYGKFTLEEQRARSLALADRVRQQLLDAGLDEQQVQSFGIGSLIPPRSGQRSQSQVDLVLMPQGF